MTAALPASALQPGYQLVPLDRLEASATNPRKTFDPARLAELAKTIGEHGVLEPILARPHPDKKKSDAGIFEIVAGERRWRASQLAKKDTVPAIVRPLTDKQALEIQTIENAQREDLHPLEQADGYERLIKEFGYTPEKIADAIGKSRAHVFQIRKLKSLSPKLREAFVAGEMDTTLATVVARIPGSQLQDAAWQKLKAEFRNGFSFRVAADFIRKNFMLDLMRAPFNINDATLVAAAGECGKCPKRTGNQADLFPDVRNGNVCTDPACFADKRAAAQAKEVKTLEEKGVRVITGAEARRVLPYEHSQLWAERGYAKPTEKCWEDSKGRTYGQLAKEANLPIVKIQSPHTGAMVDAVPIADLKKGLSKTSVTLASSRSSGRNDKWAAQQRATERRLRLEAQIRRTIFTQTVTKANGKLNRALLAAIAAGFFADIWHEYQRRVAEAFGWQNVSLHGDAIRKKINALSEKDLGRLLVALSIVKGCSPSERAGYAAMLDAAKGAGLKPEAIRKELADQAKAKLKPKPKAKPKAKGKPAPKPVAHRFLQAMQPDALLAAVIGDKPMPRTEITKKLWGYIKRHGLQDKKNRRMVNADAKLLPIFGKKQLSLFEMVTKLKKHIKPAKAGK